MKKLQLISLFLLTLFSLHSSFAQVTLSSSADGKNGFPLVAGKAASIYYDKQDAIAVERVVNLFAQDIFAVTDKKPLVCSEVPENANNLVVIGTIGRNKVIDDLISKNKLDVSRIIGGWEQYTIQLVSNPVPGVKKALVIAGSDRRGASYGTFYISELIGVSPWYWWADAPINKKSAISLKVAAFSSKEPSVRYRGIFINDEDFGMKPWAALTYEKELGDIGPKTYARMCELILRLKGNYLCPAMHGCTKAFNFYPENKLVADSLAIVMGSVHCEPLLFNNASEWDRATMGEWNYITNKDGINNVLRKRVNENKEFENVYTLAMRGVHDAVMAGNLSLDDQGRVLEKAFDDQREIISSEIGEPANEIPQVFCPYKEVLYTYENGMTIPDDVTLCWGDDDFGYMKRLSNPEEQKRAGRAGVYYHINYWGPPKHALWLGSTPPMLMFEELKKAYDTTADRLWVVNVGDLKPNEYLTGLFIEMAYDMERFDFDNLTDHSVDFLCNMFGEKYRAEFKDIQDTYYHLAFVRKPEHMIVNRDRDFSLNYNEMDKRMAQYKRIADKATAILNDFRENRPDAVPAFYQLVYYPVKGAALVNTMNLAAQKNRVYAQQGRASANRIADDVKSYCDSAYMITQGYHDLLDGKWNHMMSFGGGSRFELPVTFVAEPAPEPLLGVHGENESVDPSAYGIHEIPRFSKFYPDKKYHIDVFNKGRGKLSWTAKALEPWIVLDKTSGNSGAEDDRIYVSVDWNKVPQGKMGGTIEISSGEMKETVRVSAFNPTDIAIDDVKGLYVEDNGYISIDVADYHRKHEVGEIRFETIGGLGLENKVVMLGNPTAAHTHYPGLELASNWAGPVHPDHEKFYPKLEYDFYTFGSGVVDVYTYMMPIFPLHSDTGSRYGVMVDRSPVYLPEAGAPYYSTLWIQSIMSNSRVNKTSHYLEGPGKHTIKIYSAHPGMIIQKIVIDTGGLKRSYAGPEKTKVD